MNIIQACGYKNIDVKTQKYNLSILCPINCPINYIKCTKRRGINYSTKKKKNQRKISQQLVETLHLKMNGETVSDYDESVS